MPEPYEFSVPDSINVTSIKGGTILPKTDGKGEPSTCSTGAGGGQAGEYDLAPVFVPGEPRPVDAPGPPSNADLHRYFCETWCPFTNRIGGTGHGESCHSTHKPGLHTRCPETRVEGLEYWPDDAKWSMADEDYRPDISPAHAADLLVMGVFHAVAKQGFDDFEAFVKLWITTIHEESLPLDSPEAVAIAYHRILDAEEQK